MMRMLNQERRPLFSGYPIKSLSGSPLPWNAPPRQSLCYSSSPLGARPAAIKVLLQVPRDTRTTSQGVLRTEAILQESISRCPDFIYIHSQISIALETLEATNSPSFPSVQVSVYQRAYLMRVGGMTEAHIKG